MMLFMAYTRSSRGGQTDDASSSGAVFSSRSGGIVARQVVALEAL